MDLLRATHGVDDDLAYEGDRVPFGSEKARKELGFETTPVHAPLERAVAWFRANGYLK